jgi:hypothetical protein
METEMNFLYDDIRNAQHGVHSDKRSYGGSIVYVLQLVNMNTGNVIQEKTFNDWNSYSQWYQQSLLMLQSAPS